MGHYTSIAIDSNDAVHISYFDLDNDDLKYTALDSSSNILGYSVSPALPAGLSLNIATGEISGTPTALSTNTTYTITASNSGGSSTTTITIVVNDEIPSFYYSPPEFTFTKGVTISSTILPTNTGGTPTSYTISPNLLSIFHFGINNGMIGGTPSITLTRTQFMITATNSGGSSVTYINVTINDVPPGTFSYSPVDMDLTLNQAMAPNTVSPGGGAVTSWEIEPDVPNGLNFESSNGTIWGTPTVLQTSPITYTIWANNSGGSSTTTVTITIIDEIPSINYPFASYIFTKDQTISTIHATTTGGEVTSWEVSDLPAGLSIDAVDGFIWGTPTTVTPATTYTIWANNSGGSASTTITMTVNDVAPSIVYNPDWFELTKDTTMSPTAIPTNTGGAIPVSLIDSTGSVGAHSSMVFDSNGKLHISYKDGTNGDLKYATDASGSWITLTLDSSNYVGAGTSIGIDSNNGLHIAYYDETTNDVKYATCVSSCSIESSWTYVTIDSANAYSHISLAIDSTDRIHLSIYDHVLKDLKYSTCTSICTSAGSWTDVTIDSTGDVGRFNSIAIDSNDGIHISYHDEKTYGDLKYATCTTTCTSASSWTISSPHSGSFSNSGQYSAIAVDSSGDIHISHHDFFYDSLLYSIYDGSSWTTHTVDTGSVGTYSSIALDSNSQPHIAYYSNSGANLKYASFDGFGWTDSTIASIGSVGKYTSIAVDGSDAMHIAYYDDTNNDLKYIIVDSSSNAYQYSISPDLPNGLTINPETGEISGTPTVISANTTYTLSLIHISEPTRPY